MSELTGDEPELKSGDTGEGVVLLQVRLFGLGLLREMPDGTFGMSTENAVRELQSTVGQDNNGDVTRETWEGILYLEQQYSINYQYTNPYDALTQINYDLQHPEDGGPYAAYAQGGQYGQGDQYGQYGQGGQTGQEQYAGQVSADGQWRWDGYDWQPHDGGEAYAADGGGYAQGDGYVGQVSADGQWRWDGYDWQPHDGGGNQAQSDDYVGQLSPDGRWRWDGSQWQAA